MALTLVTFGVTFLQGFLMARAIGVREALFAAGEGPVVGEGRS